MKFSECIGILLLIVVCNHQVLAHGGERCGENKYLHNGHCCNLCPAGTRLDTDCTQSSDTVCKPCDGGRTYTAYPNRLQGCLRCKHCDGHVGLVVKPEGACVPTNNTECQCREGMYLPHESSLVCVNHSLCPKGEEVAMKGTPVSDTVCQPCPYGTFSNRDSLSKCRPWRNCTALGMQTVRNGTSTRNARCEPLPTTSTEKLPTSSGTVTPASMVVKSTTVNMRKTTSSTASTTTITSYKSTYMTVMLTTAAPVSTRHSSTTATKPPPRQTTNEAPDIPHTTLANMSVTPPSFDNKPEVDGGGGSIHHGNTAEIATASVVGVIAVLLGLIATVYFVPKLLKRRRRQRRLHYPPFLLSEPPGNLDEDRNLQECDLEGQMQLPIPKGQVGHVKRTTTGATPGDNTSSSEIESLIQSTAGALPHDTRGAEGLPAIPITDVHLVKLARVMPETWQTIGMEHFEMTRPNLHKIRTNNTDCDMQIVEMFSSWREKKGKAAKLCNLCQKLNDAGIEWKVLYELFSEEETKTKTLVD